LDLSHLGPQRYTGDFATWVGMIRRRRAKTDAEIDTAVRTGIDLARAGGTAIIGDIAGIASLQPIRTMREAGMKGVSFFEVFGLGASKTLAIHRMKAAAEELPRIEKGVALGMQPHAPYSCDVEVYRAAVEMKLPLSTHLAETLDEIEFTQTGRGPLREMLERLGVWDESIKPAGLHPIDLLAPLLRNTPCIAAHLNYIDDVHLDILAKLPITVAYCPRASAYFGHGQGETSNCQNVKMAKCRESEFASENSGNAHFDVSTFGRFDVCSGHRYREMLERGVNVALGTDSIVCLDTPDRISVLDEMRMLYRRDGVDPTLLLRMATINGAKALGFDPGLLTLSPGYVIGLLAVEVDSKEARSPLECALMNNAPPRWVIGPSELNV
jgi:cytosine/adenosine deaminase-related metal-dependent hydrolase